MTEVEGKVCVARRPEEATGTDKRWNERNGVHGDSRGPGMLSQERAAGELVLPRATCHWRCLVDFLVKSSIRLLEIGFCSLGEKPGLNLGSFYTGVRIHNF